MTMDQEILGTQLQVSTRLFATHAKQVDYRKNNAKTSPYASRVDFLRNSTKRQWIGRRAHVCHSSERSSTIRPPGSSINSSVNGQSVVSRNLDTTPTTSFELLLLLLLLPITRTEFPPRTKRGQFRTLRKIGTFWKICSPLCRIIESLLLDITDTTTTTAARKCE